MIYWSTVNLKALMWIKTNFVFFCLPGWPRVFPLLRVLMKRPGSRSSWTALEQITALLSCMVTLSVVMKPSNGYGGIDPNTWMPNFKKTQSSSTQNLLRITFIPLEIGLGWIVFQTLCRSMALLFEIPALPLRSPTTKSHLTFKLQSAEQSLLLYNCNKECGPKSG